MSIALTCHNREQLLVQNSLASFQSNLLLGKASYVLDFDAHNPEFLDSDSTFVEMSAQGEKFTIQVPSFLVDEVLERVWPNFHSLDDQLRIAVLERGLQQPMDALALQLGEIAIESMTPEKQLEGEHSLEFFLTQKNHRYRCFIHAWKRGLELIKSLTKEDVSGNFIPSVYLNLSAIVGRVRVSLKELQSLQSGDLIFFDRMAGGDKQVFLFVGNLHWTGLIKEGGKIMVMEDELKPTEAESQHGRGYDDDEGLTTTGESEVGTENAEGGILKTAALVYIHRGSPLDNPWTC